MLVSKAQAFPSETPTLVGAGFTHKTLDLDGK
jgi:hypothetical protein